VRIRAPPSAPAASLGFLEARFRRPFNASNYNFNPSAQIYVLWFVCARVCVRALLRAMLTARAARASRRALGSSSTLEGHRDRGYVAPFDWRNPHVCSPDCGARGSCQAGNVCLCRDGYTGPVCSVAPRASVDAALDASYRFKAVLSTSPEVAVWWNTTEDALVMTVRAATAGYVAVGFSDSGGMVNSNAVIGFVANNVATVTEYALTARSDSGVAPVPVSELRNVSGSEQGGVTTIAFTRPLSSNGRTISLAGEQRIVWAVGNGDVVNRHVERGRASCNLLTGACTGSTNQLREAHGWLMALSMGVLLPLGVLFPRFLKQRDPLWFNLHRGVQTLALVLAWIGFFVIVGYMADVNGEHLANNHARFGLAILLLATLQFVGGVLRAKKGAPRRAAWEAAHHWMGRVTMVVALIGPFTGLRQLDPASLYWALYVLWFAFYVALSVFLEVRARMTARGPEQLPEVEGTATQDAKREASGSLTQQ
jgi:hypothetical protein